MLPDPLHPAVVHFPIVLMFLLPVAALAALWAIRKGVAPRRAWAAPLLIAVALAASAWASVETGEQQEERAEDAVGEAVLGRHEAAAQRFLAFSVVVLAVSAAGLAGGAAGRAGRIAGTTAAFLLIVAGYQVGHSGGRIVYGDASGPGLVALSGGSGEGAEGGTEQEGNSGKEADDDDDD